MAPLWKDKIYKLEKSDNFEEFLKALGKRGGWKCLILGHI